jgi:hypothetical protein
MSPQFSNEYHDRDSQGQSFYSHALYNGSVANPSLGTRIKRDRQLGFNSFQEWWNMPRILQYMNEVVPVHRGIDICSCRCEVEDNLVMLPHGYHSKPFHVT